MATEAVNADGSHRSRLDHLPRQAALAGWPTPDHMNSRRYGENLRQSAVEAAARGMSRSMSLHHMAVLAGWPTPTRLDGQSSRRHDGYMISGHPGTTLTDAADLAGWTTPSATDDLRGGTGITPGMSGSSLVQQGRLAGWPTPAAVDSTSNKESPHSKALRGSGGINLSTAVKLAGPARLTVTGQLLTGSTAAMSAGGQLSPKHSRWLMGLPGVWDDCADTATLSLPRLRRRSSPLRAGVFG